MTIFRSRKHGGTSHDHAVRALRVHAHFGSTAKEDGDHDLEQVQEIRALVDNSPSQHRGRGDSLDDDRR